MTRMLASVTGPGEAEIALGGGADIIDLKNPADGALAPGAIRATVAMVRERRPAGTVAVSAAAGDLPTQPEFLAAAVEEITACGVDYVRLGLFPGGDVAGCLRGLAGLAAGAKLIAVFFADSDRPGAAPDPSLLKLLASSGFAGAMIDTREKQAGRLLDHLPISALHGFVTACHAAGLSAGLAGSLELPDIPRLLVLTPDLLGFRGALCGAGERMQTLDPSRVQAVRALIPPEPPERDRHAVDYRLLAARAYTPAAADGDGPVDRVLVDDFVLPVRIGAYAHERAAPQRVRFAVDARVLRAGRAAEDMRDVFSYDLITDAIRLLVDAGHIGFVETLAEQIAAMVLAHPRVTGVTVRVQKLDTGTGIVGVEIERSRAAARAASWPAAPLLAGGKP